MMDVTEARLAAIAGGLSVALTRAFKLVNPSIKNPATENWERGVSDF
jgi:hypothetical protein